MPFSAAVRGRSGTRIGRDTTYLLGPFGFRSPLSPLPSPYTELRAVGSLTKVDATSVMSIAGRRLHFNGTPAADSSVASTSALARAAGVCFRWRVPYRTTVTAAALRSGLSSDASNSSLDIGIGYASATAVNIKSGTATIDTYTLGSGDHDFIAIMRSAGGYLFARNGLSGAHRLLWGYSAGTAPLYTKAWLAASTAVLAASDDWRGFNMGTLDALFATDYGYATSYVSGAAPAATAFTHTADFQLGLTVTVPAGGAIDVFFRMQDVSNYWQLSMSSTGGLLLRSVTGGAAAVTHRNAAAVLVTGHRVRLEVEGTTIKGYSNDVLRWTWTSATFLTSTAGKVNALGTGGVVTDLATYPLTHTFPSDFSSTGGFVVGMSLIDGPDLID